MSKKPTVLMILDGFGLNEQREALRPQHRRQLWHGIEACDGWRGKEKQQIEDQRDSEIPVEDSGIVEVGGVLALDKRRSQSTIHKDGRDGDKDIEHGDTSEVIGHQQARQHQIGQEVDEHGAEPSDTAPQHSCDCLFLQILRHFYSIMARWISARVTSFFCKRYWIERAFCRRSLLIKAEARAVMDS